jgi:sigma-B regulation protein RsbU (phosphoserine phosphatase)
VLAGKYDVASASSPEQALATARQIELDLAVLDIRMPTMDGFELMQLLKADQPDLDVILMTGSMTEPDAHLIQAIQQGAFYFVQKPFDRQVLQTLVERCLELRRLRALADRELRKLRTAQNQLLPQVAPADARYEIAFRYRPFYFATGDYHGFFPQPDDRLAVFVGDSSGHGPSACMLMATMRTLLHAQPALPPDPGDALSRLNRLACDLFPESLFMTAVYLTLGGHGAVQWAAAGQHPPLRIAGTGQAAARTAGMAGLPLGIDADQAYKSTEWRLDPGERLLVFTDGIVEASNTEGAMLSVKGLQGFLHELSHEDLKLEALVDSLVARVTDFMGGSDFEDDFTVLAIERRKGE